MEKLSGKRILSGTVWASVDRFAVLGLQFIVNIVLARLLTPSDFGAVGLLTIFIVVSQVFIDGGFGSALIQKKEPTQEDYSTIFYWNLFLSIFLYALLFLFAPLISKYYRMPILINILRVLGLILVIGSLQIVQMNRQRKQLAFKRIATVDIISYLVGAIVGIILASLEFGAWSLVFQQLTTVSISTLLLWIITRWTPSFCFSVDSFKGLLGFGGYLLLANLLQQICSNLQGLIIGRKFSAHEMGLYTQAKKMDDIVSYTLPNILVQVMYPVLSDCQDNDERTKQVMHLNVQLISLFIFPLIFLLVLIAHPLFNLLYGPVWDEAVPYYEIICIGGILTCLQNINYYEVAAVGKSSDLFWWSIFKWGMLLLLLIFGAHWGMKGMLWGMGISSLNIFVINAALVSKYSAYKFWMQCKDFGPLLIVAGLVFILVFCLSKTLNINVLMQAFIYCILYCLIVILFKFDALNSVKKVISIIHNSRQNQ